MQRQYIQSTASNKVQLMHQRVRDFRLADPGNVNLRAIDSKYGESNDISENTHALGMSYLNG